MTDLPRLRRAGAADAAAARELTRAAYARWVPVIGREPMPMRADYDRAVTEHIVDLWEEVGELVALIECVPETDHLLIENVAVRPDQQGRGRGDALLRHAEALAQSLGLSELQLYTNAQFAANIAFYARRGYAETERREVIPGSITVFMRKRIEPSAAPAPPAGGRR